MELAQKYLSSMLMLKDKEGDRLIDVELNPTNWDTTEVWITLRNKRMATANRLSSKFPLQWTRACLSVELLLGRVTLVADGVLLDSRNHKNLRKESFNQSTLVVGEKLSGQVGNVNAFSSALSVVKMREITTPGGEECGSCGDIINWSLSEGWELHGRVKKVRSKTDLEPCSPESQMNLFFLESLHSHTTCMHLCQKIGDGRSPPVRTLEEWKSIVKEVSLVSPEMSQHIPRIWLAAVKRVDGEWADFYTSQRLGMGSNTIVPFF